MKDCKLQTKIIILINLLITFLLITNVLLYFYKNFVTPTFLNYYFSYSLAMIIYSLIVLMKFFNE